MKIVVVGCGDWGKNIARTLKNLNSLHAICDHHHSEKAVKAAEEFGVPLLTFEEALKENSVDGMVISTQTNSHYELAKSSLEKGLHVFVEKPLVPSKDEALELEALSHKKNCVLMVGHLLRYHAAFERLHTWVREEKLGDVLHVNTSRKNLGKIYPNEGVIWDLAPHDLSMVLALIGKKVDRVLATGANYAIPIHADEAMISLKFKESPQAAFITLSRLSPLKEQKITVSGTSGMAVFDDTLPWESKLTFFDNHIVQKSPTRFEVMRDMDGSSENLSASEPLKAEMTHFLECIKSGAKARTPAREAIEILDIIHAAHQSIKDGGWVYL